MFYLDADGSATVVSIFIKLVLYFLIFVSHFCGLLWLSWCRCQCMCYLYVPLNEYETRWFGVRCFAHWYAAAFSHSVPFRSVFVFVHREMNKKTTLQLQHLIYSDCVIAPRKSICYYIICRWCCCCCCQQIIFFLSVFVYLPHYLTHSLPFSICTFSTFLFHRLAKYNTSLICLIHLRDVYLNYIIAIDKSNRIDVFDVSPFLSIFDFGVVCRILCERNTYIVLLIMI